MEEEGKVVFCEMWMIYFFGLGGIILRDCGLTKSFEDEHGGGGGGLAFLLELDDPWKGE